MRDARPVAIAIATLLAVSAPAWADDTAGKDAASGTTAGSSQDDSATTGDAQADSDLGSFSIPAADGDSGSKDKPASDAKK